MKRYYSHSKLGTFEQCPFKYKLCYIDKVPRPDRESIEAFMGNKVHAALKALYDGMKGGITASLEGLLDHYGKIWERDFSEKVFVVKAERTPDDYKDMGAEFIGNYYGKHFPFDEDETLETEHRLSFPLDAQCEVVYSGIVDRISKSRGSITVHDYKTSSRLPSKAELEGDRQLAMYQIAAGRMFSGVEIELAWHFLAFNEVIRVKKDQSALAAAKESALGLIKRIEAASEFEKSEGPLCAWCDYAGFCPLAGRKKEGGAYVQQEFF
jgi:RecB family exonuclease